MAITTQLLGPIGFIRAYAALNPSPGVLYKLPPAPYGWVAVASGDGAVTINWVNLSTGQTVRSFAGTTASTGSRTSSNTEAQQLATTVGIGVRFTDVPALYAAGIAPIGQDGDAYAMPPT